MNRQQFNKLAFVLSGLSILMAFTFGVLAIWLDGAIATKCGYTAVLLGATAFISMMAGFAP